MKKIYRILLAGVFIAGVPDLKAQIYLNNFTGVSACPTNGNLPTMAINSTGTPVTRTTVSCTGTANVFNSSTLNNTSIISNTSYIEFSATADPGYLLNLTSLSFFRQGSNSAPNQIEVRYSTDAFGSSTSWGAAPLTAPAGSVATWDFADFSTTGAGTVTFRIYPYGTQRCDLTAPAALSTGTFRVDDVTINGTVTAVTPNTISPTTLTGAPFNLANCFATANGTIDFTSTGTFNAGNTYTAQLSDALGSFATPVNIGSLSSTANAGTISITIPAGTLSGAAYAIQIVSSNPVVTSTASGAFTINQSGSCSSSTTDYFRSKATGNWGTSSTWESSPDNASWINATLSPTSAANTITIRNGNTVTVAADANMDQLTIQSGGVLLHSSGVLTVNDGAGDDVIIQNGGYFTLSFASPVFSPLTASANVNTGGVLRVTAGGMTGAGTGINASNYIYQDASVLEMNTAFSTSNVTYFPNVDAVTIPKLKTTTNLVVGSSNRTVINGVFEAGGGTITFQNAGTKTFRNGITGASDVNGATSGKFIINGLTASLGGAGLLTLPASGLDIGPTSTVTMISDKNLTGNIALLADAYVQLGIYTLGVTGNITGGATNAHIVTGTSGFLTLKTIASLGSGLFPIGASPATYNPLTITNNDGAAMDFSARVEIGLNPPIGYPATAVNRTWTIRPAATPSNVDVLFEYSGSDGNTGFNYGSSLEVGQYTTVWNVIKTGIVPSGSYQANVTNITSLGAGIASPLVLANLSSILAFDGVAVNYFTGTRQNGTHKLNWKISCTSTPSVTINVERSADTRNFVSIYSINATAVRCAQPFDYIDVQPHTGINYYRLKIADADGKITYSNIIALINGTKGFALLNVAPNPLRGNSLKLNTTSATATKMETVISDMQGRVVTRQIISISAGFNSNNINVRSLAPGTYNIYGITTHDKSGLIRFVKL